MRRAANPPSALSSALTAVRSSSTIAVSRLFIQGWLLLLPSDSSQAVWSYWCKHDEQVKAEERDRHPTPRRLSPPARENSAYCTGNRQRYRRAKQSRSAMRLFRRKRALACVATYPITLLKLPSSSKEQRQRKQDQGERKNECASCSHRGERGPTLIILPPVSISPGESAQGVICTGREVGWLATPRAKVHGVNHPLLRSRRPSRISRCSRGSRILRSPRK